MSLNNQKKSSCFGHKLIRIAILSICFFGIFLLFVWNFEIDVGKKIEPSHLYMHFNRILFGQTSNTTTEENDILDEILVPSGKNHELVIDTPGCKIPNFDPWDPSVIKLIKLRRKPYDCRGLPLFFMAAPNGSVILKHEAMEKLGLTTKDVKCWYQGIKRKHEPSGSKREIHYKLGSLRSLKFGVDLGEDHVKIICTLKNRKKLEHFLPLVRLKHKVEELKSNFESSFDQLNIIMVGIDSVSKLNYLRHFRKTQHFLRDKLSAFEMKGYIKVGENTFPNLIPMLTGHFYDYYWNETMRDTFFWDKTDLIWKRYADQGYRTFYAEDMPLFGTFQYGKRGFYDPPTDYYFRPLALALKYSKLKKVQDYFCVNSDLEVNIMYKYMLDFITAMEIRPFFAFTMISTITHDDLNKQGYADDPTVQLLENLLDSGTLNNSALFLFSDHGIRFGPIRETYIGKFEERMPFMFIHFPDWFLERYPQAAQNLQTNQKRLMTLFDVHATLLQLLDMEGSQNTSDTFGLSLLEEIPENRTCSDANIEPHYCPCTEFDTVPLDDSVTVSSAKAIVKDINTKLKPYENCSVLKVANITDAKVAKASNVMLQQIAKDKPKPTARIKTLNRYLVTLTTKPGGAMFEGSVQYDRDRETFKVLDISRINMYGNQSICIDIHRLKIFCYCYK